MELVKFTPTFFGSQMEPSSGANLIRISCWHPEDGSICDPKHVGVNFTWTFNVFLINIELWVHELFIIESGHIDARFEHEVWRKGIWCYGVYRLVIVTSRTLMSLLSTFRSQPSRLSSTSNTRAGYYSKNFIHFYHVSWRHIPGDRTKCHTGAVGTSHPKFPSPFNFVTWHQRELVTPSDRQIPLAVNAKSHISVSSRDWRSYWGLNITVNYDTCQLLILPPSGMWRAADRQNPAVDMGECTRSI